MLDRAYGHQMLEIEGYIAHVESSPIHPELRQVRFKLWPTTVHALADYHRILCTCNTICPSEQHIKQLVACTYLLAEDLAGEPDDDAIPVIVRELLKKKILRLIHVLPYGFSGLESQLYSSADVANTADGGFR
jgi:hypothetical protein